jgi:carboxylesterase
LLGLLALHGFTGSPSELGFLVDRVRAAGYPVRAPLLPGHGTTPGDLQARTFDDWLAAGRAELKQARAAGDTVVVCGFSMGTLVALSLASDEATRKDVAALVLLGCAIELSPPLRAAFGFVQKTKMRLPDAYMPKPFGPDIRDKTLAGSIGDYDKHPVRAAMEVYRAGQRLLPRLSDVTCPTLVLHGERDRVCSVRGARELASLLGTQDVRIRTYPRSAHMLALDYDREEVARDVIAFLDRQRSGHHTISQT